MSEDYKPIHTPVYAQADLDRARQDGYNDGFRQGKQSRVAISETVSDKDKAPERIWIQSDLSFFKVNGNGTFYATPDANSIAYVPESKVREAREEVFKEVIEIAKAEAFERRMAFNVYDELKKRFALERAAESREGGEDG